MKAFFFALLAVIGVSFAASVLLEGFQGTVDRPGIGSGAKPDPQSKLSGKTGS